MGAAEDFPNRVGWRYCTGCPAPERSIRTSSYRAPGGPTDTSRILESSNKRGRRSIQKYGRACQPAVPADRQLHPEAH